MNKINIYLVDDHSLFREGLKLLLSKLDFVEQIYEAKNGREILDNFEKNKADLVLLDIEMPEINGIQAATRLLETYPNLKIIALSMYSDEQYYTPMIEVGVKGFLLKNSDFSDVKIAISEVLEGNNYFSPEILKGIVSGLNTQKNEKKNKELTKREVEVLLQICKGLSNNEIGDKLFISKRTVDKHRENLLLKTNTKNTAELVIYAIKNKIFTVN
ncbi:MAG: response regulator transcription factor [Bacteroidales bacterium]|nr:response regulator transcription factor [Bacteroidales bacterium]